MILIGFSRIAIYKIISDPSLAQSMGKESIKKVRKEYDERLVISDMCQQFVARTNFNEINGSK